MFGGRPSDSMLDDLHALGRPFFSERHYGRIGDSLIFGSPSYINNKNINIKKITSTMLFYREVCP